MTPAEIRKRLDRSAELGADAFKIARGICGILSYGEAARVQGQDLLLRAMERYSEFGGARVLLDAALREVGLFPYLEPEELGLADRLAYERHRPAAEPTMRSLAITNVRHPRSSDALMACSRSRQSSRRDLP